MAVKRKEEWWIPSRGIVNYGYSSCLSASVVVCIILRCKALQTGDDEGTNEGANGPTSLVPAQSNPTLTTVVKTC